MSHILGLVTDFCLESFGNDSKHDEQWEMTCLWALQYKALEWSLNQTQILNRYYSRH